MVRIDDAVVTEQLLKDRLGSEREVEICPRAKLTPLALDYLAANQVKVSRKEAATGGRQTTTQAAHRKSGERKEFKGIFCPNIVIFDSDDRINYAEMERYVNWLIEAGIHGLYPNGSTGEFVRLSSDERKEVVRLVTNVNRGRVPVLAGASEANLRDVLRMSEYYAGIDVDAISLVPPYYYEISDTSLFEYFAEIARQTPLDVLLYNIPQFTQELTLEIMEQLLPFDRIVGTKDSSRDMPGIIPEVIVDIYERTLAGDIEDARNMQYRILDLINLMLLGVNFPEGFKTGVAVRGFDVGPPRQTMSDEEREYLLKLESQISCILKDMGYDVKGARACPVTHLPSIVDRT